jgi:hypothetical protein
MGRAFYRFGHDVALRLSNGQAFALRDAELGAIFGTGDTPICLLRGSFTAGTYRALVARGSIAPNSALQALAQPVAVQLNLKAEWAANFGKDAVTLHQMGRRLDQNLLTDEVARKLLVLDEWQLVSAVPLAQSAKTLPLAPKAADRDPAQEDATTEMITGMITEMATELWLVAEEAGEATQPPPLDKPVAMAEAVKLFFADEGWGWETVADVEGLLRTVYDGQNGSWMCYTQLLPGLEQIIFYSLCPVSVPAPAIPIMTEYLCRVNAELSVGNFEMDFSHNAVRFRTSVDVTDIGLSPLLFRNLVYPNLVVMDIYLPEMLGIIAGGQSAIPAA